VLLTTGIDSILGTPWTVLILWEHTRLSSLRRKDIQLSTAFAKRTRLLLARRTLWLPSRAFCRDPPA
jgi:hypothetical protein